MSATDALLQDLLDQAKITNTHLAGMFQQAAKGGGGGGGTGGGSIPNFSPLNMALKGITSVGNIVSNVFSSIGKIGGALVGSFTSLAQKAFEGKATFSDLFDAAGKVAESLPLIGGALQTVFGLFQKFISYQENLLISYQQITKSGASFAGNLIDMRLAASAAYMTLDRFSSVVRENSSLFATAIGGVDKGIKTFTAAQNALVNPNGPFGKNLMGLGVTAEEAGDMLALYMNMQGNMSKVNRQSTTQMAASTANLIQNLDSYAKITGESRDAMEAKLKDQAMDEALKAFLSALDPEEAKSANMALAAAAQAGGKGLRDEVAVRIMSNNAIQVAGTEQANALRATTGNMSAASADFYYKASKMGAGSSEFVKTMEDGRRTLAKGTDQFMSRVGGPGFTGAMVTAGAAIQFSAEQMKTRNRLDGEVLTAEERLQQARSEQEKQFKSTAGTLAAAQMQLKIFGNQIGTRFFQIIQPLEGPIMRVGNLLMDAFGGAIEFLTKSGGPMTKLGEVIKDYLIPAIDWTANWFKDTFLTLADSKNATDFFDRLLKRFGVAWDKISEVLGPPIKKFWEETAKPMLAKFFTDMLDWIISALRKNSRIARFLFSETETEKSERENMEKDPIYQALLEQKRESQRQLPIEYQTGIDYDSVKEEYLKEKARLASEASTADKQRAESEARQLAERRLDMARTQATRGGRENGSIGATGNVFENFGSGTPMTLHGTEGVITPSQMGEIVANAMTNNQMAEQLNQLNNLTQQLITIMRETAENTRRNVQATQNLNGNLFV